MASAAGAMLVAMPSPALQLFVVLLVAFGAAGACVGVGALLSSVWPFDQEAPEPPRDA